MTDRSLITTGAIGAVLAAICRATPLLAVVLGGIGLTAWLAKADYVFMPVLFLGVALVGFGLYRRHTAATLSRCEHQTRERQVSESKACDLVVIGSGTAAQVVSFRARAAGWSVAVIDHLPVGGTCALRGCDPKKMLISGAEAIDMARRMRGRGVTGELGISWPELIAFKRTFTDPCQ